MKPDIDEIIEHTIEISEDNEIHVEKIVLFGSIITGDYTDDSDIDIIMVSSDFTSIDYHQRTIDIIWDWDREYGVPDIIPLTPDEFKSKSQDPDDVVSTAIEIGEVYDEFNTQ